MSEATLIICAHGTNNAAGQRVVLDLVDMVRAEHPETNILDAYVDVQEPSLARRLSETAEQNVVVVPLLLARGYHSEKDIPDAVEAHPSARIAATVGPDEALSTVLMERLAEAEVGPEREVVLAVAGSSRASGTADAETVKDQLQCLRQGPVRLAFCSAAQPRIAEIEIGEDTAVASYLLGPGFFYELIQTAAKGRIITEPLGAHPLIAKTIWQRYQDAL